MKLLQISRLLPALTFACAMGVAPLAMAQTTAAPAGTMAPMTMAAPAAHAAKPASGKLPKADSFKTVADASAHCPGDTVVWSTLSKSKSFHLADSKSFGKTKHGGYVCKADAISFGFHQAKN
jgi:hypothetical protein